MSALKWYSSDSKQEKPRILIQSRIITNPFWDFFKDSIGTTELFYLFVECVPFNLNLGVTIPLIDFKIKSASLKVQLYIHRKTHLSFKRTAHRLISNLVPLKPLLLYLAQITYLINNPAFVWFLFSCYTTVQQEELRTGEKAVVLFKFIKHPEYLKVGAKILFREGVTKGIGHVTKLLPIVEYQPS